jgi:hypothetical protein
MKISHIILILIFYYSSSKAQELYVAAGKNITSFDYKSSNGSDKNLNFRSGSGNNFEIGYVANFRNSRSLYSVGLVYNEFNAKASNYSTNYSWKTKYIGIINKISFKLFDNCLNSGINAFITLGFNSSILVSGDQFINNYYYNLTKNEDFSGLNLQPFLGLNYEYNVHKNLNIQFGYNFSKSFNVFNKSDEKISFNTHQFQFGLLFYLF